VEGGAGEADHVLLACGCQNPADESRRGLVTVGAASSAPVFQMNRRGLERKGMANSTIAGTIDPSKNPKQKTFTSAGGLKIRPFSLRPTHFRGWA
jgi:hypothetical protein